MIKKYSVNGRIYNSSDSRRVRRQSREWRWERGRRVGEGGHGLGAVFPIKVTLRRCRYNLQVKTMLHAGHNCEQNHNPNLDITNLQDSPRWRKYVIYHLTSAPSNGRKRRKAKQIEQVRRETNFKGKFEGKMPSGEARVSSSFRKTWQKQRNAFMLFSTRMFGI